MRWLLARVRRIAGKISRLSRTKKTVLASAALIVLFSGSYGSFRLYSYTQGDPNFCRLCHTMDTAWGKWSTSSHSMVNCHSCHEINPVSGAELVVDYLINKPNRVADHASVSDAACKACHYSGDPEWVQVANTAGHQVHVDKTNIACQVCHGMNLHQFEPSTHICDACHPGEVAGERDAIKVPQMQELHCEECHPFLAENSLLRPTRETCLSCHQKMPVQVTFPHQSAPRTVVFPDNGPMKWDCMQCHKLHQAKEPVVDCNSCHGQVKTKGLHAVSAHSQAECLSCHWPHRWRVTDVKACVGCHSDMTPQVLQGLVAPGKW